ncbi:MAG: beta-lactamase family protein [Proteobacteria bacterium]|nr:beta-lactamase family protein [Pseudomonadota bacterium]
MNANAIDAVLRESVDKGEVAGVVAMAANADGTLYQGAFGRRSAGSDATMTQDTVFWIHSMTKAITGTACMQLVEQGKLDLDTPAARLMPALAAPQVLEGFDAAGEPRLRPARGTVTLRNLLTHTSGFVYDTWNANQLAYTQKKGLPRLGSFTDPAGVMPLAFDPGTQWQYGIGIDWAGKLAEAASGTSLDAYFRANVFAPLGMKDTGYALTDAIRARLAGHHDRQADGSLKPGPFEPPQDPASFNGGGGLYSTAGDYMRFLRMLLRGGALDGARLLKPETVAAMAQNHIGDVLVGKLHAALPAMSNDVELYPDIPKKWGLTFLINTRDVPGARRAGSLAWAGLRNTYFWLDPATGIAGVLLTQVLPFADASVLGLLDRFERAVYAGVA